MSITVEFTYHYAGLDFDVEAEVTLGAPAFTSGLPENCHPAEDSDVELTSVTVDAVEVDADSFSIQFALNRYMTLSDVLAEKAEELAVEQIADNECEAADRAYDEARGERDES